MARRARNGKQYRSASKRQSAKDKVLFALAAIVSRYIGPHEKARTLTTSRHYESGTLDRINLTISRINMIQHTSMRFVFDAIMSKPGERALRQRARMLAKSKKSVAASAKRLAKKIRSRGGKAGHSRKGAN